MAYQHRNLAEGRWQKFSLAEQLANIGAEVGRAAKRQDRKLKLSEGPALRALELFDLTLDDRRWRGRLKEIARLRELFLFAMEDKKDYKTSLKDLEKYFMPFMILARREI